MAAAYLSRGLDPSLFEVGALARAESGGRLPVRVSYAGAAPSLPGVTITSASSGTARGYLTLAGARVFGAALERQFAGDHADAAYGQDGLFGNGVSVALAGAGTPRRGRARPSYAHAHADGARDDPVLAGPTPATWSASSTPTTPAGSGPSARTRSPSTTASPSSACPPGTSGSSAPSTTFAGPSTSGPGWSCRPRSPCRRHDGAAGRARGGQPGPVRDPTAGRRVQQHLREGLPDRPGARDAAAARKATATSRRACAAPRPTCTSAP